MQFGENPARIARCRLPIGDGWSRKLKLENRNWAPMGRGTVFSEFRISSFAFRISAIDNRQFPRRHGVKEFESIMRQSTNPVSFRAKRGISPCFCCLLFAELRARFLASLGMTLLVDSFTPSAA
jgi:hypothetical protein